MKDYLKAVLVGITFGLGIAIILSILKYVFTI
jgi:hypothetical protein